MASHVKALFIPKAKQCRVLKCDVGSSTAPFLGSSTAPSPLSPSNHSVFFRLRPLAALADTFRQISSATKVARGFATRQTTSSLNDSSPNWSNRPPKETIMLDGCDFEHWLVVVEKPEGDPTREEIIDGYVKILASFVGS